MANLPMFSEITPQTSRTILFEKFNGTKSSLIEIIQNEMEMDGDFDKLQREVEQKLEVRSFDEFLAKFEPVIYEVRSADEATGKPVFTYSDKPEAGSRPKKIVREAFYKMVQEFIRAKYQNGQSNLDAFYAQIDELLAPEKALFDAQKKRKKLETLMTKYQEASDKHRTEEAKKFEQRLHSLQMEICDQYQDDALELLPLAIADTQEKLGKNIAKLGTSASSDGDTPKLLTGGNYGWDENGRLVYKPVENNPDAENPEKKIGQVEDSPLRLKMKEVSTQIATINNSPMMQMIFLDSYSTNTQIVPCNDETVQRDAERLRNWTNTYKEAKETLYHAIISLVQKVLDVEMYFRHATQGIISRTPEPLIIANCTLQEAMENNGEFLKEYLQTVNSKPETRIFFAILPPAEHTRFERNDDANGFFGDSVNLKGMLELLSNEKIVSFFNLKANEETGFSKFKDNILNGYESIIDDISEYTEHSVLCYPNFTVIPSRETDRLILKAQSYKGEEIVPDTRISIDAVYVDSAYVSAGIVVASQNKEILKSKGYALRKAYPCTRFDLEMEYTKFLTFFNMENFMNWSEAFEDRLDEKKIGFCFSSNDRIVDGKKLNRTYFYFVRNNNGEPLYSILTERVIDYYFKNCVRTGKFSASQCDSASKEIMSQLDKLSKTADKEYGNLILRPDKGESLEISETFSGISVGIKFAELPSVRSVVVSRKKSDN